MSQLVLKYLDPGRYAARLRRLMEGRRCDKLRYAVEGHYRQRQAVFAQAGERVIVCEGMWDNPNHFFRLHLMLAAMPDAKTCRLVGILRNPGEIRQRRSLESLGVKEFVYLEDHPLRREQFLEDAQRRLEGVRTHRDLLQLNLPQSLPPYVYYDTVLKLARHPQPPLTSQLWITVLTEVLRNLAIYEELFQRHEVVRVVSSHPWKNEYATLCWTALARSVPCYYVTGFCEGTRIRHFATLEDFLTPVEHVSFADFEALSVRVRRCLIERGRAYLAERELGKSSDINARYAFRPENRWTDKAAARQALGVPDDRPLVAVYAQAWFDFPHTFAMQHFTDFLDWMRFTVEHAARNTTVTWLLKPHPCDLWYGGIRLTDQVRDLPPHVRLCSEATDSLTVQLAADCIVTVHGTVAIEGAARGLLVLCADRSYYSDWGFTYTATSRENYGELLGRIQTLAPTTREQQERAMACAAVCLAPTPEEAGLLSTSCDTSGLVLYDEILSRFMHSTIALSQETKAIDEWVVSKCLSYAAYHTIRHYERS